MQIAYSRCLAEFPQFGPGCAIVRLLEVGESVLVAGVHGTREGHLSIEILVEDEYGEEDYSFHASVTPDELAALVVEWAGVDRPLMVAPCFPAQCRERHGDAITVLGDWRCKTYDYWAIDQQAYCPEPAQG